MARRTWVQVQVANLGGPKGQLHAQVAPAGAGEGEVRGLDGHLGPPTAVAAVELHLRRGLGVALLDVAGLERRVGGRAVEVGGGHRLARHVDGRRDDQISGARADVEGGWGGWVRPTTAGAGSGLRARGSGFGAGGSG